MEEVPDIAQRCGDQHPCDQIQAFIARPVGCSTADSRHKIMKQPVVPAIFMRRSVQEKGNQPTKYGYCYPVVGGFHGVRSSVSMQR